MSPITLITTGMFLITPQAIRDKNIYVVTETTGHAEFMAHYLHLSIELSLKVLKLNPQVKELCHTAVVNYLSCPVQIRSSRKNS